MMQLMRRLKEKMRMLCSGREIFPELGRRVIRLLFVGMEGVRGVWFWRAVGEKL